MGKQQVSTVAETAQSGQAFSVFRVVGQALFTSAEPGVKRTVLSAVGLRDRGRKPPRTIAPSTRLDVDDPGAESSVEPAAVGGGDAVAEIDNQESREGF